MRKGLILLLVNSLFILSCTSDKKDSENKYFDKELDATVDAYIDNSVDSFSDEIESEGGFFMWQNYRDYLGLGEVGFKERINDVWNRSYDSETLEVYLTNELAKKHKGLAINVDKDASNLDNYTYKLLFPFLGIAFDELLIWIIGLLLFEIFIIPYIAKKTIRKSWSSTNILKSVFLSVLSTYDREQRIKERVAKTRKVVNIVLLVAGLILSIFYFDFNEYLNDSLKRNIKSDIRESITIHSISNQQ